MELGGCACDGGEHFDDMEKMSFIGVSLLS